MHKNKILLKNNKILLKADETIVNYQWLINHANQELKTDIDLQWFIKPILPILFFVIV